MNKKALFNPFEGYRESTLIAVGIAAVLLGSLLAYVFHGRFDGAIDLHFGSRVKIYQPFLDNLINVLCLSICLFLIGKYINRKTRIIDILITVLIARIPLYFLLLFNINGFISGVTATIMWAVTEDFYIGGTMPNISAVDLFLLILFAIISLAMLVWFIVFLYNGFKTATNSKTLAHKMCFALAIVVAEVITKMIFVYSI